MPDEFKDWMIPSVHTEFLLVITSNAMTSYPQGVPNYSGIMNQCQKIAMLAVSEFNDYRFKFENADDPVETWEYDEVFLRPLLFFRFFREILGVYIQKYGIWDKDRDIVVQARRQAERISEQAAKDEISKRKRILEHEMAERHKFEEDLVATARTSEIRSLRNQLERLEEEKDRKQQEIQEKIYKLEREEVEYQKKQPSKKIKSIGLP